MRLALVTLVAGVVTQPALLGPAAYDLPSAQSLADSGAEMVRTFVVDGYGYKAGAVTFIRRPGQEPRVEVVAATGGKLATTLPLAAWERVRTAAAFYDRRLVPQPRAPGTLPCLHPWSASIEAIDPARPGRPSTVRSAEQSGCEAGLVMPLAIQMAHEAVEAIPACALLDAKLDRNDLTRLAACTLLEGDRAAAALARNAFNSPWFANTRGDRTEYVIRQLFTDKVRLNWNGTTAEGAEAAAKLWSARLENAAIVPRHIVGESAYRVRMTGVIMRVGATQVAETPFTVTWVQEGDFGFRVDSAVIGG